MRSAAGRVQEEQCAAEVADLLACVGMVLHDVVIWCPLFIHAGACIVELRAQAEVERICRTLPGNDG